MGMVRFRLDGITAFRNRNQNSAGQHYCVDCARRVMGQVSLVPFFDGQLFSTLSDFGKDMAAMISCDQCGQVMETYYPKGFWEQDEKTEDAGRNRLLFKKF
jgi:hypothetical protein